MNLRTVAQTTPRDILLTNCIQQAAIPAFTSVKHSPGMACCVCTA